MKILVVEDESTLNKNISEALSAENFLVESAFDGYLAERFLKKNAIGTSHKKWCSRQDSTHYYDCTHGFCGFVSCGYLNRYGI